MNLLLWSGPLISFLGFWICFFGSKLTGPILFFLGVFLSLSFALWIFADASVHIATTGPSIAVSLAGSFIGGLLAMLLASVSLALAAGYLLASLVTVVSPVNLRPILFPILAAVLLVLAFKRSDLHTIFTTSLLGSFLLISGASMIFAEGFVQCVFRESMFSAIVGASTPQSPTNTALMCIVLICGCLGSIGQSLMYGRRPRSDVARERQPGERQPLLQDHPLKGSRQNNQSFSASFLQLPTAPLPASTRANFNYFNQASIPPPLSEWHLELQSTFEEVEKQFGFQTNNVQNQLEHLMFLLGNYATRNYVDVVTQLHNKIFSNYREWCKYVEVSALVSPASGDKNKTNAKIKQMAVWLCAWGEAANVRHMPECLCFIFHHLAAELNLNLEESPEIAIVRPEEHYLKYVIQPIFTILKSQSGALDKRLNYDDINEFFWTPRCLEFGFAEDQYCVNYSGVEVPQLLAKKAKSIAKFLPDVGKTFLEKRSWLHPIRTFLRLIRFFAIGFHILVMIAFWDRVEFFTGDFLTSLSGVVITIAGLSLCKELLDVWAEYGIISKFSKSTGFIFRLVVKGVVFYSLALAYIDVQLTGSQWYFYLAGLYMLPQAVSLVAAIFPSLSTFARSSRFPLLTTLETMWWPVHGLYVGRNVHQTEAHTSKYQLFWIIILAWKFYCSYTFQISILVTPTLHLLNDNTNFQLDPASQLQKHFLVFVLWVPFIFVYLFDGVIWFAVAQATVGLLISMKQRLGDIRDFQAIAHVFISLPEKFMRIMVAPPRPRDASVSISIASGERSRSPSDSNLAGIGNSPKTPKKPSDQAEKRGAMDPSGMVLSDSLTQLVPVAEQSFTGPMWRKFAVMWNEVIDDIRQSDLISNEERYMLQFRYMQDTAREFYLPLFLTAGAMDSAVNICVSKARAHSLAKGKLLHKERFERELASYFAVKLRRDAVSELWEHCKWLLVTLLGDRHTVDIEIVFEQAFSCIGQGGMLDRLNLHNIATVRPTLLKLVRGLRIALTAKSAAAAAAAQKERERIGKAGTEGDNAPQVKKVKPRNEEQAGGSLTLKASSTKGSSGVGLLHVPSRATLNIMNEINSIPQGGEAASSSSSSNGGATTAAIPTIQGPKVIKSSSTLSLIQHQLRDLLNALGGVFKPESEAFAKLQKIMLDHHGFFWSEPYANTTLTGFLEQTNTRFVLQTLYAYMSTPETERQPESVEARRRLMFFVNSLLMDMPRAPPVRSMYSWTVLTPFYQEDILYSLADLKKETEDGLSLYLYLRTIYPREFENFLQRLGLPSTNDSVNSLLDTREMEARQWATHRGQTLGRTVDGMMLYDKALRLLAQLEAPEQEPQSATAGTSITSSLATLATSKFQYVVACQVYGQQKRAKDSKAREIELLLGKYPSLRVAYIDSQTVPSANGLREEFYSVLIKGVKRSGGSSGAGSSSASSSAPQEEEVQEVYRVKLPGNPIIGEGKPENQNHAVIFSRGEMLQTIDMNQENYLEEAFKMRNLLQEFDRVDGAPPTEEDVAVGGQFGSSGKPTTIVGFREHIYTGGLSSIANYMALQEGCFVTLGQRVLNNPLRARFHYGHPDLFDKLFFITRGGFSKASKNINLSEDIFAGFNAVLRAGDVSFHEYIQVGKGRDVGLPQLFKFEAKLAQGAAMQTVTRDVYRLCCSLDMCRLFSFFYGGLGFYLCTSLTIWALYFFVYARFFLASYQWEDTSTFSDQNTIAYWFGQIGFLLTLPIFAALGGERGFLTATWEVLRMLFTGGPLFFVFHMGTKSHYFEHTLLAGEAKYRATGRGFVTTHDPFGEIFRFHATSHFYKAFEILLLLLAYAVVSRTEHYWAISWAGWFVAVSWIFAPYWFNPMAFRWEKTVEDANDFHSWMQRRSADGDKSWKTWWLEEIQYLSNLDTGAKSWLSVLAIRHAAVGFALLAWRESSAAEVVVSGSLIVCIAWLTVFITEDQFGRNQALMRGIKAVLSILALGTALYYFTVGRPDVASFFGACVSMVAICYFIWTTASICLIWGVKGWVLETLYKARDYAVAAVIFALLGFLSILVFPSLLQTRLMFHNAFSRGVLINNLLKSKTNDSEEPEEEKPSN